MQRDTKRYPGIRHVLEEFDDTGLHELMMNLAGHDMATLLDALHGIQDDQPTCFIAYTIKGFGLPFAGHKDNHAGLMTLKQMETFKRTMGIAEGEEWSRVSGLSLPADEFERFLAAVPFAQQQSRTFEASPISVPSAPLPTGGEQMSTQQGFGRILTDLAAQHCELASHCYYFTGRYRIDKPRGLGQSPGRLSSKQASRRLQRRKGAVATKLGNVSVRAASRAWYS